MRFPTSTRLLKSKTGPELHSQVLRAGGWRGGGHTQVDGSPSKQERSAVERCDDEEEGEEEEEGKLRQGEV